MKLKTRLTDVLTINQLLAGAESQAQRSGEEQPGAEHLLLSALDLPDGSAGRAFERIGAEPDKVMAVAQIEHGTASRALRHMGVDPAALVEAASAEITAQAK